LHRKNNKNIDCKELYLIIQLLKYQINKDTALNKQIGSLVADSSINFDEFLRLTKFHKVYTHIYEVAKELDCFPNEVIKKLRVLNVDNARKSLTQTYELKKLNKLFAEKNINFTVLKGQLLSVLLYKNTTQRSSKDIDILIEEDDIEKTVSIFEKDYTNLVPTDLPLKFIKPYTNHFSYKNKETNVIIEVHWKLFNNEYLALGFTESAKHSIVQTNISQVDFNRFSFNYKMLYCLMHGAIHQWFRLFWIRDMAQFCNNDEFNIVDILELAERFRVTRSVVSSLLLCNELFGVPEINEEMKLRLLNDRKIGTLLSLNLKAINGSKIHAGNCSFIERIQNKYKQLINSLLLQKGWKYKIAAFKKHFVSSNDIERFPLPERLFFLYIFLHPIFATVRWYRLRYKQ